MTTLNLDKFSPAARSILEKAQNLARKRQHRQIEPAHALVSLLMLPDGRVPGLVKELKVDLDGLLGKLDEELRLLPRAYDDRQQLPVSAELEELIRQAEPQAQRVGSAQVEPEHLLMSAASQSRGLGARLLRQSGLDPESVAKALGGSRGATATKLTAGHQAAALGDLKLDNLIKYGRDMTAMAERGEFDPVIGREDIIRRAIQVLARRNKNNPVLIGPPGVGKTAIVELLCARIASGDVPEALKGRRIFSLDLGSLVAGTSLRGQFEERIKGIVDEIVNSQGRVIVYIDEIHNMVSAGGQEGSGNAANLLKPALARGELRCIGSTTPEEYKSHIEEDKALVRRFQAIQVEEPDIQQTIAVLRGLKGRYESHHRVRISDAALVAAARFATRYITDRHLPDKAIDLIDEACSSLKIQLDSKPAEIDGLERRIQNLEIERAALLDQTNVEAREALARIDRDLSGLRGQLEGIARDWKLEKEILDRVVELTAQAQAIEGALEEARKNKDLARAAELQYGVKVELNKELEEKNRALEGLRGKPLLKTEVGPGEVADVVSAITGIPVNRMLEEEREKLLRMEEELGKLVIGQDPAIASISKAVRMSRAGVSDPNQPIGSFLFVGPTGVGKTELAKALARFLFDTEEALIRIDMSEYQEQAKVNTLIGSARGYVGSEKGGVLTEAVRRRPYSVVLFDEAEKAHPKVFDILLQVLDEGRLSDSQGLTVDFTNTIILMTSNVGSRDILEMSAQQLPNDEMEARIRELIKDYLKPEFINRIQDVAVFNALDLGAIRKIVDIQLRRLQKILAEQKLSVQMTDDAKAWLAKAGYEPEYGARPLKRAILNEVQDPLALMILEGKFERGDTVYIGVDEEGEELVFSREPLPED